MLRPSRCVALVLPALVLPALVVLACRSPAPPARNDAEAAGVACDAAGGGDVAVAGGARRAVLAARAAEVVDAFWNRNGRLTPDGRTLVFVSNRDGVAGLFVADVARPDAPPRRLVATSERVRSGFPTPDGRAVVYLTDRGGDENWSIARVDLDGGGPRALTTARLQRDEPRLPPGRPGAILYSARRATRPDSALYLLEPGGEERRLYEEARTGFLADVTRDGRRALWRRLRSAAEGEVAIVDLGTGRARTLYPQDGGQAAVLDGRLSADGRRAYVATDGGGEQALLLALDLATGREVARYQETRPATATLAQVRTSADGAWVALLVDAGDRSEVRLLDAATLRPGPTVELPAGTGWLDDFTPDGRRLLVTWSTPERPHDVLGVDAATGAVGPLRADPRPTLERLGRVEVSFDAVTSFDGTRVPVNVYRPAGATGRLPVIVFFHGGPASSSAVRWSPHLRFFLSLGWAWVEPNVRGSAGFGRAYERADDRGRRADALGDVEAVARWAAARPWADPRRLVAYGPSYGGYLVLSTLARHPDLWAAGVELYGPADLRTFLAATSGWIGEVYRAEFGEVAVDGPLLDALSPLRQVDRIVAPLFVYAGANDPRVPRAESDAVVAALRARRVPVEYMVAPDEGHGLARRANQVEFLTRAATFLEVHAGEGRAGRDARP